MTQRIIIALFICSTLSGCLLAAAAGGGYVLGREMEENQGTKDPEIYK